MKTREMKNSLRRGNGVKGEYIHSHYSTNTLITLQNPEKRLESTGCGFGLPLKVCILLSVSLLTVSFFSELSSPSRPVESPSPLPDVLVQQRGVSCPLLLLEAAPAEAESNSPPPQ